MRNIKNWKIYFFFLPWDQEQRRVWCLEQRSSLWWVHWCSWASPPHGSQWGVRSGLSMTRWKWMQQPLRSPSRTEQEWLRWGQKMVFSMIFKKLNIYEMSAGKMTAFSCLYTCGLRSHQRFAGCSVMQGDDLDSVLCPWMETTEQHVVLLTPGCRTQLSLALLRAGVEDAVWCHSTVWTVPVDAHGGGVNVGEDEVFGTVHSCKEVCSWKDKDMMIKTDGKSINNCNNSSGWTLPPRHFTNCYCAQSFFFL